MRYGRVVVILIIIFSSHSFSLPGQTPKAVKGVIDLRQFARANKFIISLNGEWEFYWGKMLYPRDFEAYEKPNPDMYCIVPSYWTDYANNKIKPGRYGYATYHLTILLPENLSMPLGFDVPVFDSSYDLWINGELQFTNGQTGRSESETKPGYRPYLFKYISTSDSISVIINVSNFSHRRGGFWLPMRLGTFPEVQKAKASKWAGDYATMSILFSFSIFFLIFFILYPKDRIMAFFSMALLGLAFRPLFTSSFLIYDFFEPSWLWTVKFEYICLYLVMFGWTWFVHSLYPSKFIKAVSYLNTFIFSVSFLLTLFLPVKVFSYSILAYYPAIFILMAYVLYQSLAGLIKRRIIDGIYFGAFLLLTAGVLHDILVSLGKSSSPLGYIMSFVVVVFIFIQAVLLLYKWVIAYYEKENLQKELEFMNRNLEQLINERTLELKTRNEEIEIQSKKIALQNKQLTDTIQLKNKIFSVIAHDLRSPVVNILYMLNLLKEEEFKEKYDTFANSSIQYAQMVINLLENMLVWGRGQEDKIKFSPEKHDLANIILTNLSIFKETSDRKDISVNFTQIGSSVAYFDKDLIDIVIRNLLSNAVKYTQRGGRISILVKDRTNNDEGIMLKICDNGIGIPATKQRYLFTMTEIESTPGTEDEKGTGLGLKLCQELIKINKGTIEVESKEGEGTCFIITLPEERLEKPRL
jgi:signal transduction histidine kinase